MTSPHLDLSLDSKLGAAFIGNVIAAVFYGITSVQTFIYFKNIARDTVFFKGLISFLWLLDTLHIALITHGLYFYTVSNFANPLALLSPTWSVLAQVYITCVSDLIVRGVFARRVWLLSGKKYYLVALIGIFSLLTAVTGFIFASEAFEVKSFLKLETISYLMYIALASGVAADVVIAISLVTLLFRSRTGFKRTDSLVNVLMVYTINTGLFTTQVLANTSFLADTNCFGANRICTTLCLITYIVWPDEFIFMGVYFSLSALYLNSLLATLNARTSLREKPYGVSTVPLELSDRGDRSTKQFASYGGLSSHSDVPSKLIITVDRQIETLSHDNTPHAL